MVAIVNVLKTTDAEEVATPLVATRMEAVAMLSVAIHGVPAATPSGVGNLLTEVATPSGVQTTALAPPSVALSRLHAAIRCGQRSDVTDEGFVVLATVCKRVGNFDPQLLKSGRSLPASVARDARFRLFDPNF